MEALQETLVDLEEQGDEPDDPSGDGDWSGEQGGDDSAVEKPTDEESAS